MDRVRTVIDDQVFDPGRPSNTTQFLPDLPFEAAKRNPWSDPPVLSRNLVELSPDEEHRMPVIERGPCDFRLLILFPCWCVVVSAHWEESDG